MSTTKRFTHATGAPVADNTNIMTAGRRGPALLQHIWPIEKMAHFDWEVIPERRMHAKGWGAHGTVTITHDITRYTKAKIFSEIGKQTPTFARFSTVASERGAADAERSPGHPLNEFDGNVAARDSLERNHHDHLGDSRRVSRAGSAGCLCTALKRLNSSDHCRRELS
jgi:hypothetical protein